MNNTYFDMHDDIRNTSRLPFYWRHLRHLPPIHRRMILLAQVVILLLIATTLTLMAFHIGRGRVNGFVVYIPGWSIPFFIPHMIAILAPVAFHNLVVFRVFDKHDNNKATLCGNCRFDLRGHGERANCPECGVRYGLTLLRNYWTSMTRVNSSRFRIHYMNHYGKSLFDNIVAQFVSIYAIYFLTGLLDGYIQSILLLSIVSVLLVRPLWKCTGIHPWQTLRRRIHRHNYCLCLHCGHPLAKTPEQGKCSKCDTEYVIDDVIAQWKEACPPHWEEDVIIPSLHKNENVDPDGPPPKIA